jgi:hypothetical protein
MNGPQEFLNSFPAFASMSIAFGVGTLVAMGRAFFSGFDARAARITFEAQATGPVGCRTFESWSDNALRVRLVYRELYFLRALALLATLPLIPLVWHAVTGKTAFGWLAPLLVCAVALQVYRDALDNRLKAIGV